MTDVELLANWLDDLSRGIHRTIEKMPPAQLAWQPDAEANSIGVTVWHMARWLDILCICILQQRAADEEQWHTRGWAKQTGYDPRGIGFEGTGAVTGYTLELVKQIPILSADELLAYFDQVCEALRPRLLATTNEDLNRPVTNIGNARLRSTYEWTKGIMQGNFGHLGEIFAIKGLYERAHRAEAVTA